MIYNISSKNDLTLTGIQLKNSAGTVVATNTVKSFVVKVYTKNSSKLKAITFNKSTFNNGTLLLTADKLFGLESGQLYIEYDLCNYDDDYNFDSVYTEALDYYLEKEAPEVDINQVVSRVIENTDDIENLKGVVNNMPYKVSDLPNDKNYLTYTDFDSDVIAKDSTNGKLRPVRNQYKDVDRNNNKNNLVSFFTMTRYVKGFFTDKMLNNIQTVTVDTLPTTGDSNKVYLVQKSTSDTPSTTDDFMMDDMSVADGTSTSTSSQTLYDTYIYDTTSNAWTNIGESTGKEYYTKDELNQLLMLKLSDYAYADDLTSANTQINALKTKTDNTNTAVNTLSEDLENNFYTKTEIEGKGYLTTHQDISGKQDVISDLETIRSGAALGATAIQEHQSLDEYYTKAQVDAKNYLTEHQSLADYYNKSEVNTLIGNINSFDVLVVTELPSENISNHTIYLVSKDGEGNDVHDEYLYINGAFEKIGNTAVDLSGYYTKSEVDAKGYLTEHQSLENYALKTELPTKVSDLTNDSGFLTEHQSLSGYYTKSEVDAMEFVKDVTQAEYDALTEYENVIYNITDAEASSAADYYTKTQIDAMFSALNNI